MGLHAENHLQSGRVARTAEAANRRYLEFLSAIEDPRPDDKLDKLTQPVDEEAGFSGFNLFDHHDEELILAFARGEFTISGLQNKTLRRCSRNSAATKSRGSYDGFGPTGSSKKRPFLQVLRDGPRQTGRSAGLKLRELVIIPALAAAPSR